MNSDFFKHTAMLLGTASFAVSAEVSLQGDGKLTGEVTSMDADGTIELVSPISEKPLKIRGDRTIRVDFGKPEKGIQVSEQRIELANGDTIPAKVLSLTDGFLNAESGDIGQIAIPREVVSAVQLGIFPKRVIYSGPTDFSGWKRDKDGSRYWTIDGGEFVAEGVGTISRDAGLPDKFIIRFSVAWDNYPNFQFRFAEPVGDASGQVDRYILQFSGSTLGIYRESKGKSANSPIVVLSRTSERLRNNHMDVEIRVDRTRGKLQLYIDGEKEGVFTDYPPTNVPSGTGISLLSRASRESRHRISKLEVLEWDERGDRYRTEDRGDGKTDSLITRTGDRHSGKLIGIRRDGETSVYLFKSDFQKEIMELPEEEVSTLFLGVQGDSGEKDFSEAYVLSLRGGGQMSVSSCIFGSGRVRVVHPLLGPLEIDRKGIISLERSQAPKAKQIKSR